MPQGKLTEMSWQISHEEAQKETTWGDGWMDTDLHWFIRHGLTLIYTVLLDTDEHRFALVCQTRMGTDLHLSIRHGFTLFFDTEGNGKILNANPWTPLRTAL